jgi:hypothetical protein
MVSKVPDERYILSMRYLWIGALVCVALLGAACSGGSDKHTTRTTVHHHHRARHRTTTTTTKPATQPVPKLASGPRDKAACASFARLSGDTHKSHRVIARAFRNMFRKMKRAENHKLRRDSHAAAVALLQRKRSKFKKDFVALYATCYEMK